MLARFTPNQTPFLVLKVPRASLLEDSLAFLRSVPDSDLTKELKIEFVGEQGVDAGGLKKEFFQLLVPVWKSTSELQVGRLKFDFHTGWCRSYLIPW